MLQFMGVSVGLKVILEGFICTHWEQKCKIHVNKSSHDLNASRFPSVVRHVVKSVSLFLVFDRRKLSGLLPIRVRNLFLILLFISCFCFAPFSMFLFYSFPCFQPGLNNASDYLVVVGRGRSSCTFGDFPFERLFLIALERIIRGPQEAEENSLTSVGLEFFSASCVPRFSIQAILPSEGNPRPPVPALTFQLLAPDRSR